jgi:hypothetical protein
MVFALTKSNVEIFREKSREAITSLLKNLGLDEADVSMSIFAFHWDKGDYEICVSIPFDVYFQSKKIAFEISTMNIETCEFIIFPEILYTLEEATTKIQLL